MVFYVLSCFLADTIFLFYQKQAVSSRDIYDLFGVFHKIVKKAIAFMAALWYNKTGYA